MLEFFVFMIYFNAYFQLEIDTMIQNKEENVIKINAKATLQVSSNFSLKLSFSIIFRNKTRIISNMQDTTNRRQNSIHRSR